jgi:hypothetical protein
MMTNIASRKSLILAKGTIQEKAFMLHCSGIMEKRSGVAEKLRAFVVKNVLNWC